MGKDQPVEGERIGKRRKRMQRKLAQVKLKT
jgi:hypothetical protein